MLLTMNSRGRLDTSSKLKWGKATVEPRGTCRIPTTPQPAADA
jgi:hypothetical protein